MTSALAFVASTRADLLMARMWCLYIKYLNAEFRLDRTEDSFELPLDSITALQVKRAAGRGALPPWPGVKHLNATLSAQFQDAAAEEAAKRGIARVHLDAVWWSVSRDDDET